MDTTRIKHLALQMVDPTGGAWVAKVAWDGITPWTYPLPHDTIMEDKDFSAGIGDWYEEAEGIFYRPINALPPDIPEELQPPPVEEETTIEP